MELVDGATLAERIAEGPIPIEEALHIAKQIADALEAAHEKGIVHRDLKPANIKLRPDRSVKVLDFGLAKPAGVSGLDGAAVTANSPAMLSVSGMILGTAGYMSPEQARGKVVDKRADIWAFGVVLYEMLTGERLFEAETVSDTLAAVLTREPDWGKVPVRLQPLLRRCLAKDPNRRLRDISCVELLLDSTQFIEPATQHRITKTAKVLALAFGVLFLFAAGMGIALWKSRRQPGAAVVKFEIEPGATNAVTNRPIAISPDGKRIVFQTESAGKPQLWVRELDSLSIRPLPGTDDATFLFWSPDSRNVAFFDRGAKQLKRVDLVSGRVLTVCGTDTRDLRGGTWSGADNDVILFAVAGEGIFQVPAAGGSPTLLIRPASLKPGQIVENGWPWFLPDGRHFLYVERSSAVGGTLFVSDLNGQGKKGLAQTLMRAAYANGHLLYLRGQYLVAQPFDAASLRTTGPAVPVVEGVDVNRVTGTDFFLSFGGDPGMVFTNRRVQPATYLVGPVGQGTRKSGGAFQIAQRRRDFTGWIHRCHRDPRIRGRPAGSLALQPGSRLQNTVHVRAWRFQWLLVAGRQPHCFLEG
jgi:hypothetical protein